MVSVFTSPDENTWEVGRKLDKLETTLLHDVVSHAYLVFSQSSACLHQVNTETILHFFINFHGNSKLRHTNALYNILFLFNCNHSVKTFQLETKRVRDKRETYNYKKCFFVRLACLS